MREAGAHAPGWNDRFRGVLARHGLQLAPERGEPQPEDYPTHGFPLLAPLACPGDPVGWPLGTYVRWAPLL